jgi:hypothetical protein
MNAIRHSCRTLSFRFRWTAVATGGASDVRSGWSDLRTALEQSDALAAWSPVVADGPRRLLYCVVIDAAEELDDAASAAVWETVRDIPCATTLRIHRPSPGVAWRAVLPLSTPIDLADDDDARAWTAACAGARDAIAGASGRSDAAGITVHAAIDAPFAAGHGGTTFFDGLPVNVDGMRASRDPDAAFRVDTQLRLGDARWNVSYAEAKLLAFLLWQIVGNDRAWPSSLRVAPNTSTAPVLPHTGLSAHANGDGTVQLVLGPLSWKLTRDEAASLSAAFAEYAPA